MCLAYFISQHHLSACLNFYFGLHGSHLTLWLDFLQICHFYIYYIQISYKI